LRSAANEWYACGHSHFSAKGAVETDLLFVEQLQIVFGIRFEDLPPVGWLQSR
jgi:hypothetical protein